MILSCCFRNPHAKRQKPGTQRDESKSRQSLLEQYDSEPTRPRQSGTSSRRNSGEMLTRTVTKGEKHPPSRIEKRIQKQRSQESVQAGARSQEEPGSGRRSPAPYLVSQLPPVATTPLASPQHPPLQQQQQQQQQAVVVHRFRKSPSSTSSGSLPQARERPRPQSQALPSPPATPRLEAGSRRLSSEVTQHRDQAAAPAQTSVSCQALVVRSRVTEAPGLKLAAPAPGTSSVHASSQTDNQITDDGEVMKRKEREIADMKGSYDAVIQKMNNDHAFALDQARDSFNAKLRDETSKHKKEIEESVLRANNRANEAITKLNDTVAGEKRRMQLEHQEAVRKISVELRQKEEEMSAAFREVEQREQAWQDEKEDILQEVQRLKAEASKMVAVLAAEYEAEEELGEDRKRSLTAEVYSLQLVVEMRTQEVRGLRDKVATATHQLEAAAVTQNNLEKAEARIEDLEEQLKKKVELEQAAAAEKWVLESSVSESTKMMERMSMNVEELQWRIRNNYELPVGIYAAKSNVPTISDTNTVIEKVSNKTAPAAVNRDIIDTPSAEEMKRVHRGEGADGGDEGDSGAANDALADKSPSSDLCMEYDDTIPEEAETEDKSDGNNNINDVADVADIEEHIDQDSLDEGLGDISSDGEVTESPELKDPCPDKFPSDNNNSEEVAQVTDKICTSSLSPDTHNTEVKERRPSRISFETPL